MNKTELVRSIIRQAGSTFVSVTFVKADGTDRQLTFNPLDHRFIKGTGKANTDDNLIKVRDIAINQWRSFRVERLKQMKANGETWEFAT